MSHRRSAFFMSDYALGTEPETVCDLYVVQTPAPQRATEKLEQDISFFIFLGVYKVQTWIARMHVISVIPQFPSQDASSMPPPCSVTTRLFTVGDTWLAHLGLPSGAVTLPHIPLAS